MKSITPLNIIVVFIVLVILTISINVASYNQVKSTISQHHCVATNAAVPSMNENESTKVYYTCDDHPRWLESYDSIDAMVGN